jgi:Rab-GTPase-TBC domain
MFAQSNGEGQKNLRKILRAYALYNPVLGYCQGMGMIAGLLLMRMPPEV